jgi:hypothetical protein
MLHPIGAAVAGMLGQRPAVDPRQAGHQRQQIVPAAPVRLRTDEQRPQPAHQLLGVMADQTGLYHGRDGHLCILLSHVYMIMGWPSHLFGPTPRRSAEP